MRSLPSGYEPVRVLGSGGFGEVVLARHLGLDRLVAVKRIHAHALTGPEDLERFRREGQVLAGLAHPAVVRVFDFRRDDAGAVLVMEYVEGASLADLLDTGPVPVPSLLLALADVADALAAGAEHGIAHRDVKPGNVFVLPDGHAKLGDFGLARIAADPAVFHTAEGISIGTPAYFPPETGQSEPDARSDAYSFAVMAFEVLTGRLPFEGLGALEMVAAHLTQAPPSPADLVPGLPTAASEAVLAGLVKDPTKRLLPQELVRRLAAVPVEAWPTPPARTHRPAPPTMKAQRPPALPLAAPHRSRRPLVLAALVLAPLGLVAAGLVAVGGAGPRKAFAVESVRVESVPTTGHCPTASFVVTAVISTNGEAGTVTGDWTQPDGRPGPQVRLTVPTGQRRSSVTLRLSVSGSRSLNAPVSLTLTAPRALTASSPPVNYSC